MENPNIKWMITRGAPNLENLHIGAYDILWLCCVCCVCCVCDVCRIFLSYMYMCIYIHKRCVCTVCVRMYMIGIFLIAAHRLQSNHGLGPHEELRSCGAPQESPWSPDPAEGPSFQPLVFGCFWPRDCQIRIPHSWNSPLSSCSSFFSF